MTSLPIAMLMLGNCHPNNVASNKIGQNTQEAGITMVSSTTELTVLGQSLQSLYNQHAGGTFIVNRRYQRKLVWGVEEKEALIDSVSRELPIPLILLAESNYQGSPRLEIIDGLQRMNAIIAFIENEFPLHGNYFDLETLADTKLARDQGQLTQQKPILDRSQCVSIVNYQLPVSTYRSATDESVDEVFRRINSSGRKLSLQEIRQAGVTSELADLVRRISAGVRRDVSLSDTLPLKDMPKISINNKDLPYGLQSDEIFWVVNGILDKDAIRESRDEELILDILLDMILDPMQGSGVQQRNRAYGRGTEGTSEERIAARIKVLGAENITRDFEAVLDVLKRTIIESGTPWTEWVITQRRPRGVPRYFHATFIALYHLMVTGGLELADLQGLTRKFKHFWDQDLRIPQGGSSWGQNRKADLVPSVQAQLKHYFKASNDPLDKRRRETAERFEMQLHEALTEDRLFELKQGFTRLDGSGEFDEDAFDKILRTASAMANSPTELPGSIFFGVADTESDAARVSEVYQIQSKRVNKFLVTGTRHELKKFGRDEDQMMQWLATRIKNSKLDAPFASLLANSLQVFEYDGYLIWYLMAKRGAEPVAWDGGFYRREGNSTVELKGAEVTQLVRSFST